MVGGGRHHTPLPSEDVRRGRSTHTLPPFWRGYNHTLPSKTVESCCKKKKFAVEASASQKRPFRTDCDHASPSHNQYSVN